MKCAVIFDVNETMLDLGALDPLFVRWFGDAIARKEWFAQTLHFAMTLAATREFRGFGEVGAAALAEIAASPREITAGRSRRPVACRQCCDCRLTPMWRPALRLSCGTRVW